MRRGINPAGIGLLVDARGYVPRDAWNSNIPTVQFSVNVWSVSRSQQGVADELTMIMQALSNGVNVLVYCFNGKHRSTARMYVRNGPVGTYAGASGGRGLSSIILIFGMVLLITVVILITVIIGVIVIIIIISTTNVIIISIMSATTTTAAAAFAQRRPPLRSPRTVILILCGFVPTMSAWNHVKTMRSLIDPDERWPDAAALEAFLGYYSEVVVGLRGELGMDMVERCSVTLPWAYAHLTAAGNEPILALACSVVFRSRCWRR